METIYLNKENLMKWQQKAKENVMALGFFDGLHLGHCKVIKTASKKAKEMDVSLSVMSFFPHPRTVISNGKRQVCYLMPLSEKEKKLQNLGVDTFYIVEFDKQFASLSPEQFVADYMIQLGVVHAVAGFDFSYGSKGMGNMDRLQMDSKGHIRTTKVEKLEYMGEKVSSTCIRERIISGKVDEVSCFLGRVYEVEGDWDGHTLKPYPYYTIPALGRYAVTLRKGVHSIQTEIVVTKEQNDLIVKVMEKMPQMMKGNINIAWHHQIQANHLQMESELGRVAAY